MPEEQLYEDELIVDPWMMPGMKHQGRHSYRRASDASLTT